MGSAVSLRADFDGDRLRLLDRQTKDARQARRSWRLRRSMMVVHAKMLAGWAA